VPALLQALHPLFRPEEEPGARDNAAGAVGRMLLALGGALPVEQIVPVLVGALPLQVRARPSSPGGGIRSGRARCVARRRCALPRPATAAGGH
jgi:hypothetical protein